MCKDKVWLKTYLEPMALTPTKKINTVIYFENLIVGLHVLYILNSRVKFRSNQILFTIRSIKFFFFFGIILYYKNLKFKHLSIT